MVWGKAGSTTLTSTGDTLAVSGMTASKFNQVMSNIILSSNSVAGKYTFNNNTGSNYAYSNSYNGATDGTGVNQPNSGTVWQTLDSAGEESFQIMYSCSISGQEKLSMFFNVDNDAGTGGVAPNRREGVFKYIQTADISSVELNNTGSGDYAVDTNLSVLGSDLTPAVTTPAIPAFPALMPSLQSPSVGGWVELARTTLGSSGSTIDVTSIPDKRYYMVLRNILTASADVREGFNSDTGSNYARRYSANGGSDVTSGNDTIIGLNYSAGDKFIVDYISNISSKEKLVLSSSSEEGTAGAGNAPNRMEVVGKWANTSNVINEINTSLSGGSYNTGTECVVLGWDDSDTHTTNFWEELASVQGDGTSTTLSSGTITAKKYLWVQVYADTATSACGFQFNNDTGANYARRYNMNGGSDGTQESHTSANISGSSTKAFINCFIINNSANEKLLMCNTVYANASGAGNYPERSEDYSKWANTSSQITEIDVIKGSNWGSNSIIKVWGSN